MNDITQVTPVQLEPWQTQLQKLDRDVPSMIIGTLGYLGFARWIAFYELDGTFCVQDRFRAKPGRSATWKLFQAEFESAPLEIPTVPLADSSTPAELCSAYLFDRENRTLYRGRLDVVHYYLKHPSSLRFLELMNPKEFRELPDSFDRKAKLVAFGCLVLVFIQTAIVTCRLIFFNSSSVPTSPLPAQVQPKDAVSKVGQFQTHQ